VAWHKPPCATTEEQIAYEFATLRYFWEESDRQGLRMPEDGQVLRNAFYKMERTLYDRKLQYHRHFWPPTEMLSLLGLAQHSGIGTRLLDWSWDPYVAAYFAASGIFGTGALPTLADRIAIWKLLLAGIEVQEYVHGKEPEDWPVRLITAPTADNPNLRAQKGAFTLHNTVYYSPTKPPDAPSLDEVLVSAMASDQEVPAVLTKTTLPSSEAPKLLSLLSQRGYHAGSLFPGFEGVARLLDERRELDELMKRLP
jgi:FRG domain